MSVVLIGCGEDDDDTVIEPTVIENSTSVEEKTGTSTKDEVVAETPKKKEEAKSETKEKKDDDVKPESVEEKKDTVAEKKTEEVKTSNESKKDTKTSNTSVVQDSKKEEAKTSTPVGNTTSVGNPSETPKKEEPTNPPKTEEKVAEHTHVLTLGMGGYEMRPKADEPCAIEAMTWNVCSICGEKYVEVPWGLYSYNHTIVETQISSAVTGYGQDENGQYVKRIENIYSNICSVCGYDQGNTKSWDYVPCTIEEIEAAFPDEPDEPEEPTEPEKPIDEP